MPYRRAAISTCEIRLLWLFYLPALQEVFSLNEVLRQEKKFFVNIEKTMALSGILEKVMISDSHNGPLGYSIRSLYFDTPEDKDFNDKVHGLELRRKIRLRIYNPDSDFAMLEIKQKQGAYQKKRSLRVSREDAQALVKGNYSVLLKYKEDFAAECYAIMHMNCYRPKVIVEYMRKAYIAKENRIRITIDSEITGTEACCDLFSPKLPMYPALDKFNAVLEVKYNGFLLSYIKRLVSSVDCSEISVSKYCLARGATLSLL